VLGQIINMSRGVVHKTVTPSQVNNCVGAAKLVVNILASIE